MITTEQDGIEERKYVRFEFPAPEENWIDSISSVASTIFQSGSDAIRTIWESTHPPPSKGYRFLTSSTCSMSRKRDGQSVGWRKQPGASKEHLYIKLFTSIKYSDLVANNNSPPGNYFLSLCFLFFREIIHRTRDV